MNHKARLFDIMERSLTGPVMAEEDFDLEVVAMGIRKIVKKYEIKIGDDSLINFDKDLADRVWNAAIEFLAECGVYSKDTGRIIRFSEKEIRDLIKIAPAETIYGTGNDAVLEVARTPDDTRLCLNNGGSVGTPCPNEYFIPVMASYMQEPLVEMHCPTTNTYNITGSEIRTRTPLEIAAAWEQVSLFQHVAGMFGRPGMAHHGIGISVSDVGHLSAGHRMQKTDSHCFGIISELKADNAILNKMAHLVMLDATTSPYANPIYGGMGGGLDGQTVLMCAEMIALSVVFLANTCGTSPTHPIHFCTTTKEILQQISVCFYAISRNSTLLTRMTQTMVGGPVTKTFLYEIIAATLVAVKAGISQIDGPRGATGAVSGACTGLEARFQGELIRAAVQIDREKSEEIVQKAYAKYKDDLANKPYGKPFWEAYDLKTLKPTDEWRQMYEEVKDEAISWGLPL
ncbi:MAG TPA: monomethylamine:corrinoid methyltransferase [Proteobacteria bacterium]|nr:monomethylamine:corrinoid methyltransferase [Pseudomonadota bacterium]